MLAEDAVHDAFVRLCESTRRPSGSMVSYVFAAVRNAASDLLRQRCRDDAKSTELFEQAIASTSEDESPAVQFERDERQELLQSAILLLDESSRETVILKTHAGLTFDAIGEITGERPSTIATRYRRALEKLQDKLRDQL
jgi:RNA polymerase sigma-70 factor, ECF subfamily